MNGMTSSDATPEPGSEQVVNLKGDLDRVEAERSELLRTVRELRSQLADAGPVDAADRTAVIRQAEELEALAAELQRRRDTLAKKAGESR
jgi:hypothetical protein